MAQGRRHGHRYGMVSDLWILPARTFATAEADEVIE
jgi:hypothetical protein